MTLLASLLETNVLGFFLMFSTGEGVSFGFYDIVKSLTIPGWAVIIILLLQSVYIIAIGIERMLTYNLSLIHI